MIYQVQYECRAVSSTMTSAYSKIPLMINVALMKYNEVRLMCNSIIKHVMLKITFGLSNVNTMSNKNYSIHFKMQGLRMKNFI